MKKNTGGLWPPVFFLSFYAICNSRKGGLDMHRLKLQPSFVFALPLCSMCTRLPEMGWAGALAVLLLFALIWVRSRLLRYESDDLWYWVLYIDVAIGMVCAVYSSIFLTFNPDLPPNVYWSFSVVTMVLLAASIALWVATVLNCHD